MTNEFVVSTRDVNFTRRDYSRVLLVFVDLLETVLLGASNPLHYALR